MQVTAETLAVDTHGRVRFTRPDGSHIEAHPRLTTGGSVDGLRLDNRESGESIDASSRIIPGDGRDDGIAIEGLLRLRERLYFRGQTAW